MSRADVTDAVEYGLAAGRPVRTLLKALSELGCPVERSFFHVMRCDAAVGGGFAPDHGVILCHNRLHTRREVLNAMAHELIHAYDHCRFREGGSSAGGSASGASSAGRSASAGNPAEDGSPGLVGAAAAGAAAAGAGAAGPSSASAAGRCFGVGVGGMDWSNCSHHACTEIRAANLSGDCSLWQELMRGNLPLRPGGWGPQQAACVARRAALSVAMNPACGGREGAAGAVAAVMGPCLADTAPFDPSEAVARP